VYRVNGSAVDYIILALLGAVVAIWGSQLSRIISSIVFGAFSAYILWKFSLQLWNSFAISVVLMLLGLFIGLAVGFIVFRIALSIISAYIIASILTTNPIIILALTIVLALILYVLGRVFIPALFAITGALMVYKALVSLGLSIVISIPICILLGVVGFYNQFKHWI